MQIYILENIIKNLEPLWKIVLLPSVIESIIFLMCHIFFYVIAILYFQFSYKCIKICSLLIMIIVYHEINYIMETNVPSVKQIC